MMQNTIAALAFATLAAPALVQATSVPRTKPAQVAKADTAPVVQDDASGFFGLMARAIGERSEKNCDPALDVPELSATRTELLMLRAERAAADSRTEMVAAAGMANNGSYAVCFDTRLKGSAAMAVVYNNGARIIALNPDAPNHELALRLGYATVRETWNKVNAKELPESALATPVAITPPGVAAGEVPAAAPHRLPEYRQFAAQ